MKITKVISHLKLALMSVLFSDVSFAQVDLPTLMNLKAGPGVFVFAPVLDLGLLPHSVENGGAVYSAAEDLLLGENGPLPTVLGLGGPLKGQLVPVFTVITENPLSTGEYFMSGGTVISPGFALPRVPLLNAPLPSI